MEKGDGHSRKCAKHTGGPRQRLLLPLFPFLIFVKKTDNFDNAYSKGRSIHKNACHHPFHRREKVYDHRDPDKNPENRREHTSFAAFLLFRFFLFFLSFLFLLPCAGLLLPFLMLHSPVALMALHFAYDPKLSYTDQRHQKA